MEINLENIIAFLDKYADLSNYDSRPILFSKGYEFQPEEWTDREDPHEGEFWLERSSAMEIMLKEYEALGFQQSSDHDFELMFFRNLPNASNYLLVDIGSHIGSRITLEIAKRKPNLNVILVDNLDPRTLEKERVFRDILHEHPTPHLLFSEEDPVKFVNLLLQQTTPNVTYRNKLLTLDDYEILAPKDIAGRKIIVSGLKNPKGLGNITLKIGVSYKAEQIYLNNSGINNIAKDSPHYSLMKDYLSRNGVKKEQVNKIITLLHDPNMWKYYYDHEHHSIFAKTLKSLFALAQKDFLEQQGYTVQLFAKRIRDGGNYNNPDHHLIATKK